MSQISNYTTPIAPTWCPGCGNYLVLAALKQAFVNLKLKSENIVVAHDIGCSGNMADFLKTYALHTLHGRAVPVAMGVKLANPKLTVLVYGGDGGIYGEGLNHLISAARLDVDIKILVSNNYLYSLTTGQTSPTTPKDAATKSTPQGNPNLPINAVSLLSAVNPKVFARTIPGHDIKALISHITTAINHPGLALLDITQNCLAFGKQLHVKD